MKTDDFISMLSSEARMPPRKHPFARWLPVVAASALSLVVLAAAFGIRADLAQLAGMPLFWTKVSFVAALAALGWRAAALAGVPGARLRGLPQLAIMVCLLMAIMVVMTLAGADPADRARQFWGSTWATCPFIIALLSAPIFAAMLHAMRQLAPTRLRLAGGLAGFAAGAIAAALYCLHCPELAPSFVGVWYVLGMLIPTAAGALLGPRLLAW